MEKTYRTLTNLIHHLASFTDDNKSDIHDNLRDCKFRNIVWFEIFANKFKAKSSYLLHLDICSYQKNFEYFSIPLKKLNKNFNVIGITEPKVKSNQFVQVMLFCLTFFYRTTTHWNISSWSSPIYNSKIFLSTKNWFEHLGFW